MLAPWGNPVKTAGSNGSKRPKKRPSDTTPYRDRLSNIITLRERGTMRESGRGSLMRMPHSGLWKNTQSREISKNIKSHEYECMKEKFQ